MPPPEDHAGDSMSNGGGRPRDDDWFIHRVEVGHRHACGRPGTRWGRKIHVTTTKNLCHPQSTGPMYLYYLDLNQLGEVVTP